MSFPASAFDFVGETIHDDNDEWSLNCDLCTNVGTFSGPIYKIVNHPEEEGWVMLDGKICCDLCMLDLGMKFGDITVKEGKP